MWVRGGEKKKSAVRKHKVRAAGFPERVMVCVLSAPKGRVVAAAGRGRGGVSHSHDSTTPTTCVDTNGLTPLAIHCRPCGAEVASPNGATANTQGCQPPAPTGRGQHPHPHPPHPAPPLTPPSPPPPAPPTTPTRT